MSKVRQKSYVLFRSDSRGPGLLDVAERLRATTSEIKLLQQGTTGLLVQGGATAIRSFAHGLQGWCAEENKQMRG